MFLKYLEKLTSKKIKNSFIEISRYLEGRELIWSGKTIQTKKSKDWYRMYLRNFVQKKNFVRERQSLYNNSKQDDLTVIRIIIA